MLLIYKMQKYLSNISIRSKNPLFINSYESQSEILNSFRYPVSLIERSLFQYQCQMYGKSLISKVVQNVGAFFLLIYYLAKPYKRSIIKNINNNENIAVFLKDGATIDIVPVSLQNEYDRIYECPLKGDIFLSKDDKKFIWNSVLKYWYLPFFCFKCVVKLAIYSRAIYTYQPDAIITHNEYSFTSSFLTGYCHFRRVEHVNVMHGEKLFNIRDSFVQYDRYYVWDRHYVNLLTELRADINQFRIAIPNAIKLNINNLNEYKYEYTYYLGAENKKDLLNIRVNLLNIKIPINKICIRYHPRYCDVKQIVHIFDGFEIENPNEVPLSISLSKTRYVVSLYSTVIYQAYENGKEIVIDDITDPNKYKVLKVLKYIMLNKPHHRLSEIIDTQIAL